MPLPPVTLMTSSFEVPAGGLLPVSGVGKVDGWNVLDTNAAKVVSVGALAATENNALAGNNVLALHQATLSRILHHLRRQHLHPLLRPPGRPPRQRPRRVVAGGK